MAEEEAQNGAGQVARKRGRPKGDVPYNVTHSQLSVWVPVADHDRVIQIAKAQGRSVSAVAGALLRMALSRGI